MKYRILLLCFSFFTMASLNVFSQQTQWPKTIHTNAGLAKLYEPQTETYQNNLLQVKAAVSILREDNTDPVFGVLWADITLQNSQDDRVIWKNASITNIKFPGESDDAELTQIITAFEKEIPSWQITDSRTNLLARLANSDKESKLAGNLNTKPPKIIYTNTPAILVLIDGQPQFTNNAEWGVEQVRNTPFTMIKNTDQQFYLYGSKKWFKAASVNGPWTRVKQIPSRLEKMDQAVRANDTTTASANDEDVAEIIVSTEPAELIQSNGEANFSPINGTNLLYMSNSGNDIFLDVNTQQYYVLISGRWYKAPNLKSTWNFISSDKLPADFAKIPEGSPKDVVLANVAGTEAANESVMEAQVPQTAKVDRKNAKASVVYDGDPSFENIEGTDLRYAVNTPGTVLNSGRNYYYVENGVWFESNSANGPWTVATQRPAHVENIPPSYPVYNAKYVYIYDATPDYVYMGYTPGYLGNYIYGPTIVYGTGYYYKPWRGRYYYPRATTWGFNMRYNPWSGWNFGLNFWGGWFSLGFGNYYRAPYWGGWWGPPVYRPAYSRPYNYNYGYYGRNVRINNYTIINNNRSNNIYRYRRDVVTHDRPRYDNSRRNGVSRPAPYTSNNRSSNGYNNGRVISGNNTSGNRDRDQRPNNGIQGDRTVNRRYEPNNTQRPFDRSGNQGNQQDRNASSPIIRPGGNTQRDANIRTNPGVPGNDRNNAVRPETGPLRNRTINPVTGNTPAPVNRPTVTDRPSNPVTENPRMLQDRPSRMAQDRNVNPSQNNNRLPSNPVAENPRSSMARPERMAQERTVNPNQNNENRVQRDRPESGMPNRSFNTPRTPNPSPAQGVQRPVRENNPGTGPDRSENNRPGRGNRNR